MHVRFSGCVGNLVLPHCILVYLLLISLMLRAKHVIKVMRVKDKGSKKIGSNEYE
jgi:hypothetical protein